MYSHTTLGLLEQSAQSCPTCKVLYDHSERLVEIDRSLEVYSGSQASISVRMWLKLELVQPVEDGALVAVLILQFQSEAGNYHNVKSFSVSTCIRN